MESLIEQRSWMYNRRDPGQSYNKETFMRGVRSFIHVAIERGENSNEMRCPCRHCKNRKCYQAGVVEMYLYKSGFVPNYYNWTHHGETRVSFNYANYDAPYQESYFGGSSQSHEVLPVCSDPMAFYDHHYNDMVNDVTGMRQEFVASDESYAEEPNIVAQRFYRLFNASTTPAYHGCTTETELFMHMKLLQTKTDYGLSTAAYDSICGIIQNLAECENKLPKSFQHSKRLVKDLCMGYKHIDVCVSGCMIYYCDEESLSNCTFVKKIDTNKYPYLKVSVVTSELLDHPCFT